MTECENCGDRADGEMTAYALCDDCEGLLDAAMTLFETLGIGHDEIHYADD